MRELPKGAALGAAELKRKTLKQQAVCKDSLSSDDHEGLREAMYACRLMTFSIFLTKTACIIL